MNKTASAASNPSLIGPTHPLAGLLCLFGFFLHMALSDPLLNAMGFHYSGVEGHFYEKIHPGTVFIFVSFAVLLWSQGNPFARTYTVYKEHTIASSLFAFYVGAFLYMSLRSGPAGLAFIIDTHMTAPICGIVLCYTPISYCRKAIHFFILIALINSGIGIVEAYGKFRIFTFDPEWAVLKEQYFRASALRGHPLNNAMFTAVALFVALSLRYSAITKAILALIFMTSLVAFGGRIGLIFSLFGLILLACIAVKEKICRDDFTLLKAFLFMALVLAVPLCLSGWLYVVLNSPLGERISAHAGWDRSAESREFAFMVFRYLTAPEILFGVSTDRIIDIAYRINLVAPLYDIENPWLLMFMYLGIVLFPIWLLLTLAFIGCLMRHTSLPLKLAVLAYFLIASTSNSFGRKDSTYLIMVCAVVCATRMLSVKVSQKAVDRDAPPAQP